MCEATLDEKLRYAAAAARVGCSVKTLATMVQSGTFPAPVRITRSNQFWTASVVDTWVASRGQSRK